MRLSLRRFLWRRLAPPALILLSALVLYPSEAAAYQDPSIYQYRDTRRLVALVNQGAELFARIGEAAFKEFAKRGSRWFKGELYIFIYDTNGVCIFHPVTPSHVGKNRFNATDILGKPMHRWFAEIALRAKRPYGWVHYYHAPPQGLFPLWKSTYVVGVKSPSTGRIYALCGGLYNMRMEKKFVVDLVNRAVDLIERMGTKAFAQIKDQAGPFVFAGLYVFILTPEGQMVLDPSFPRGPGRNALDFKDVQGRLFIRQILQRIKGKKAAWGYYMWPKPGEAVPSKKLMYLRRVRVDGRTYLVGTDYFLANPIWLRY